MTVYELIELLENYNPDAQVRLATQPHWPFEYTIGPIQVDTEADGGEVVYIGEGTQQRYLPGTATRALGWA